MLRALVVPIALSTVLSGCTVLEAIIGGATQPEQEPLPDYCSFGEPTPSGLDFFRESRGSSGWTSRAPGAGPPAIHTNLTLPQGKDQLLVVFVAEDDGVPGGSAASVHLSGQALTRAAYAEVFDPGATNPDQAISAWWAEFDNGEFPFDDYPQDVGELVIQWGAEVDHWGLFALSFRNLPAFPVSNAASFSGNGTDIRFRLDPRNNTAFADGGLGLGAFAHDAHLGTFSPGPGTERLLNEPAGRAVRMVVGVFARGVDAAAPREFAYRAADVPEQPVGRDWAAVGLGIDGRPSNLTEAQRTVCGISSNRSAPSTG